jgi:hypothetical protein
VVGAVVENGRREALGEVWFMTLAVGGGESGLSLSPPPSEEMGHPLETGRAGVPADLHDRG